MNAKVALIPIDTYEQDAADRAVETALALLGGAEQFVRADEKILLKPNMLGKALPQRAVTTHPAVFTAVAKALRNAGCSHISYGDSPGNPTATPAKVASTSGIGEAAEALNIPLADFLSGHNVSWSGGSMTRTFCLANGVTEADAIISLCKMKTHALERITGAVKNQYGCIVGVNKAAGHTAHPTSESFADMLADLNLCLSPRLYVMDGILAMEGNGPTSGTPIAMNVLLISADPVALDTLYCRLIDLPPESVPTNVSGAAAGLGVMDETRIDVLTPDGTITCAEAAARYGNPAFQVDRGAMRKSQIMKLSRLLPFLQQRPKVDKKKCIACGICEESCPVAEKAVHSGHGQKARYDYTKCIRCYCCQEMCPAKAITVHRSVLNKLFGG